MIKDRPWAERELNKYLRLLERVPTGESTDAGNPRTKVRGTKAQIAQQLHVARRICDELFVDAPYHLQPDDVHAALAELKRGEEMDAALGDDDSPTMSADGLHPWVWSAASSLWASGAHRAAVWAAMVNVNSRMQKKLGRTDLGEMKLIQEAFSVKDPEPGKPRLRLCDDSNPNLFNDLHVGAMNVGVGLYMAIRNVVNHISSEDMDMSSQEALESLATLSLFARWVHRSTVERHEDDR